MNIRIWSVVTSLLVGVTVWCEASRVEAQLFARTRSASSTEILNAVAYAGQPYGVGKVVFRVGDEPLVLQTGAVQLDDSAGRIIYPAFSARLSRVLVNRGIHAGGVHTVWFLFRGNAPLDIVLRGTDRVTRRVDVTLDRRFVHRSFLNQWWRQYHLQMQNQVNAGDYPPLAETYLTSMLQRRLERDRPLVVRTLNPDKSEFAQTFDLIFDAESVRVQSVEQMMSEELRGAAAEVPIPEMQWPPSRSAANLDDGIDVEPLASHVPEECFYIRFGTWKNQVWLKRLLAEYGSDLSQMVMLRGQRPKSETKMLDQLVLESSQIDDMFGGNLVADIAFIGRDFYIDDGPAIGVLFESKNRLFETNMRGRRKSFANDETIPGVTLKEQTIDGHSVTLLATPDNRIRSFYAVDGRFHLVTTSQAIVQRFFEAGAGARPLANNVEFRYARSILPLEREDTVFAYLSRPFFQQLLSPRYQVELMRRNRALAYIQMLQMATWAAENEGIDASNIENLQRHGFLPDDFGVQPDGSTISVVDDKWIDSRRGRRSYFVPICDVATERVSRAEADWVRERIDFYQSELGRLNPILAGIKRFDRGENVERIVFDARVAPFGGKQWELVSRFLGPPMESQVIGSPSDLISLQITLSQLKGVLGVSARDPAASDFHQMFGAIQGDLPPSPGLRPGGFFEILRLLKSVPGYVGAWPSPGYLDMFPALGGQPDAEGFTYSPFLDLWRMQYGDFSVLSFDRERLEQLRTHLDIAPAERTAQVRLRVGNIAESNLRGWLNVVYYQRGWQTSIANVRFLNMISQQFGLPAETALNSAEKFLDVDLVCSLGGEYELVESRGGRKLWRSSGWPSFADPRLPDAFEAPPMKWFRGLSLDVYQIHSQFVVHGMLDIKRDGDAGSFSVLPSFDLFKGFDEIEELPPALQQKAEEKAEREGTLQPPKRERNNQDKRDRAQNNSAGQTAGGDGDG